MNKQRRGDEICTLSKGSNIVRVLNKIFMQNKNLGPLGEAELRVMKKRVNSKVRGNDWKLEQMKKSKTKQNKKKKMQMLVRVTLFRGELCSLQAD